MNAKKQTIREDIRQLTLLRPYLTQKTLEAIHMGSLQAFITHRQQQGVKNRTINYSLAVIRHLLNQAASEWLDQEGRPWLAQVPKIKLLPMHDNRKPRPISWSEQDRLFAGLPPLLGEMMLFAVNTGCRNQEVCQLQWRWEIVVAELDTIVFVIPGYEKGVNGELIRRTKNGEDRLIMINDIARQVIERQRGRDTRFVFAHRHCNQMRPMYNMNTNGWKAARKKAGLSEVRVHDLRHTFGRRLRAAGVSLEDRQDLLGHKSGRITTHYSAAELQSLLAAVNRICDRQSSSPTLLQVRKYCQSAQAPAKLPQGQDASVRQTGDNLLKTLEPARGFEPPTN
ncbi:MAG: site-specific integrase [Pseudomonadota bacterium]